MNKNTNQLQCKNRFPRKPHSHKECKFNTKCEKLERSKKDVFVTEYEPRITYLLNATTNLAPVEQKGCAKYVTKLVNYVCKSDKEIILIEDFLIDDFRFKCLQCHQIFDRNHKYHTITCPAQKTRATSWKCEHCKTVLHYQYEMLKHIFNCPGLTLSKDKEKELKRVLKDKTGFMNINQIIMLLRGDPISSFSKPSENPKMIPIFKLIIPPPWLQWKCIIPSKKKFRDNNTSIHKKVGKTHFEKWYHRKEPELYNTTIFEAFSKYKYQNNHFSKWTKPHLIQSKTHQYNKSVDHWLWHECLKHKQFIFRFPQKHPNDLEELKIWAISHNVLDPLNMIEYLTDNNKKNKFDDILKIYATNKTTVTYDFIRTEMRKTDILYNDEIKIESFSFISSSRLSLNESRFTNNSILIPYKNINTNIDKFLENYIRTNSKFRQFQNKTLQYLLFIITDINSSCDIIQPYFRNPILFNKNKADSSDIIFIEIIYETPTSIKKNISSTGERFLHNSKKFLIKILKKLNNILVSPKLELSPMKINTNVEKQIKELLDIEINDQFQTAIEILNQQNNLFIFGLGGSGKSTFIKYLQKTYKLSNDKFKILSGYGHVVKNQGETFYNYFNFSAAVKYDNNMIAESAMNPNVQDRITKTKCLVIDEVQLIPVHILLMGFQVLQIISTAFSKPLPQIIAIGAYDQICQTTSDDLYFFETEHFTQWFPYTIEFTKNYRIKQDQQLLQKLHKNVSEGNNDSWTLSILQKLWKGPLPKKLNPKFLYITTHIKQITDIQERITENKKQNCFLESITYIGSSLGDTSLFRIQKNLKLSIGSRVKLKTNIKHLETDELLYTTGSIGEIIKFEYFSAENGATHILPLIKFNNGTTTINFKTVYVMRNNHIIASLSQLPLILFSCTTIHGTISCSINQPIIAICDKIWEPGLLSTLVGRVTKIEYLQFYSDEIPDFKKFIIQNPKVSSFKKQLRNREEFDYKTPKIQTVSLSKYMDYLTLNEFDIDFDCLIIPTEWIPQPTQPKKVTGKIIGPASIETSIPKSKYIQDNYFTRKNHSKKKRKIDNRFTYVFTMPWNESRTQCYANVVLTCLSSSKIFVDKLKKIRVNNYFLNILQEVQNKLSKNIRISTHSLTQNLNFPINSQQDSIDFFIRILNQVNNFTDVTNLFALNINTQTFDNEDLELKQVLTNTLESKYVFPLNLYRETLQQSIYAEFVPHEDKISKTIFQSYLRPPFSKILTLQLKFRRESQFNQPIKLQEKINIDCNNRHSWTHKLFSAICYQGNIDKGHYTLYLFDQTHIYQCNDLIRNSPIEIIPFTKTNFDFIEQNCYILFYTQI